MLGAAAVLVAASLAVFTLIAEDVLDGGGLIARDRAVLSWSVDHRTRSMIDAARFVSRAGEFTPLLVLSAIAALLLWRAGVHLGLAVAPAASLLLAGLASTIAKGSFDRPRPPMTVRETTVKLAAFPSGHATDAAALFVAAACVFAFAITGARRRTTQVVCIAIGLLLAAIVGVSRLVLGVHWLSDVVAGWSLGTAVALAVVTTVWYLTTRASDDGARAVPRSGGYSDIAPNTPSARRRSMNEGS